MSKQKRKYEFDNDGLNNQVEEAIQKGYANKMPTPSDEDFAELGEKLKDEKYAKNLNAYDKEVRYGQPLEEVHLPPAAEALERERQAYHSVSPGLSGGDVDA